eukprot:m.158309 g.158309  ORF g.158309 m.158309 type:complete len:231 (+) comp38730_c0_seq6:806-1498(+)
MKLSEQLAKLLTKEATDYDFKLDSKGRSKDIQKTSVASAAENANNAIDFSTMPHLKSLEVESTNFQDIPPSKPFGNCLPGSKSREIVLVMSEDKGSQQKELKKGSERERDAGKKKMNAAKDRPATAHDEAHHQLAIVILPNKLAWDNFLSRMQAEGFPIIGFLHVFLTFLIYAILGVLWCLSNFDWGISEIAFFSVSTNSVSSLVQYQWRPQKILGGQTVVWGRGATATF